MSVDLFPNRVSGPRDVPNVAVVTRTIELKQGRPRVHDEGAAGVGDRRPDLCLGILPVARIARELLSMDGYGNHRTLLAARLIARAPEGWICQRSGRVPGLIKRQGPELITTCNTDPPLCHSLGLDHACVCIAKRQNPSRTVGRL